MQIVFLSNKLVPPYYIAPSPHPLTTAPPSLGAWTPALLTTNRMSLFVLYSFQLKLFCIPYLCLHTKNKTSAVAALHSKKTIAIYM